jgi:siderophore synthetase component
MNKLAPEPVEAMAYRYSALAILNCYVREIAIPHNLLDFIPGDVEHDPTGILHIGFPSLGKTLSVKVDNYSEVGNFIYTSSMLIADVASGSVFKNIAWENLPVLIIEELCQRYQNVKVKQEMLEQIENSVALIKQSIAHDRSRGADQYSDYIESEAALIYGHSFHPAPKCRQGFTETETLLYGPEFGCSFQLHYFALSPETAWVANICESPLQPLIREMGQIASDHIPYGWVLLPCHPWQAKYLLQLAPIQKAIVNHSLKYLGASGIYFRPTASVRTLYNPDFPYFLKCSLSMRITNSVRKNAYYELDASVRLTKILSPIVKTIQQRFPDFEFVLEPFALSANIAEINEESRADLRSHFGVIFRDAIPFQRASSIKNVLSATLFADNHYGESWLGKHFEQLRLNKDAPQGKDIAREWFSQYLKHLVPPLLSAYFEHGIACEPHLQNVVVKLHNGWPSGVIMRDLEGTKLIKGIWLASMLDGMTGKALASVLHEENKTWHRISYCLFINHIAQAIYQLCRIGGNERQLWQMVRETLKRFSATHASDLVEQRIGELLDGKHLIAKANLMTRFFQHADSNASYILLPNPMAISVPADMQHV